MKRYEFCIQGLTGEEFTNLRDELNLQSSDLGAVLFKPKEAAALPVVIFAGHAERFYMLQAARNLPGPVLYFQDIHSPWFLGSSILPNLNAIISEIIPAEIGRGPIIFFGQSSGGYAALVASRYFRGSLAVTLAPQTCSAAQLTRSGIILDPRLPQKKAPEGIVDVRELYRSTPENDGQALIVVSRAEDVNVDYLWLDHVYAARMIDLPSVRTFISHTVGHSVGARNGALFAKYLQFMATGERTKPVETMQEFLPHLNT